MPVITFDKDHVDEGFLFLARRGEVGCLPNDVFIITEALFDLLKKSRIPFTQIENPSRSVRTSDPFPLRATPVQ